MSFAIYDYHNDEDIRNVLVTPQIRSRFLRMEPGSVADIHSHDLGHEIFLILEGRVIFEIGDGVEKLGPRSNVRRTSRRGPPGTCNR